MKDPGERLLVAAHWGNATTVENLLRTWPKLDTSTQALLKASAEGHADCVRLLIPHANVTHSKSQALFNAVQNGHVECVKLLLPVSTPKDDCSRALRLASKMRNKLLVEMLYPLSDGQTALMVMKSSRFEVYNRYEWQLIEDRVLAEQQAKRIQDELEKCVTKDGPPLIHSKRKL